MMLIWNKEAGLEVSEKRCKIKDIMITKLMIRGMEIYMFLVYFSVSDAELNEEIYQKIIENIRILEDKNIIVLGDFNGHIGLIGEQPVNKNGKIVLRLMEESNLVLMNIDKNKRLPNTFQGFDQFYLKIIKIKNLLCISVS